jgi:hypothetical protein
MIQSVYKRRLQRRSAFLFLILLLQVVAILCLLFHFRPHRVVRWQAFWTCHPSSGSSFMTHHLSIPSEQVLAACVLWIHQAMPAEHAPQGLCLLLTSTQTTAGLHLSSNPRSVTSTTSIFGHSPERTSCFTSRGPRQYIRTHSCNIPLATIPVLADIQRSSTHIWTRFCPRRPHCTVT